MLSWIFHSLHKSNRNSLKLSKNDPEGCCENPSEVKCRVINCGRAILNIDFHGNIKSVVSGVG